MKEQEAIAEPRPEIIRLSRSDVKQYGSPGGGASFPMMNSENKSEVIGKLIENETPFAEPVRKGTAMRETNLLNVCIVRPGKNKL